MYNSIDVTKADGVATVTLDRPELNLIDRPMIYELSDAAEEIGRDDAIRVVVITGRGRRAFTAGVDVREMKDLDAPGAREFISHLHDAIRGFREMDQVVIAGINGYCFGGGCELAMACDIRVAVEGARIGMPEIQVGIPSVIEAALMPSLIGAGWAREMILLGDPITAEQARGIGMVGRVVAEGELSDAVREIANRLLGYSPIALRLQKRILNRWLPSDFEEVMDYSMDAFSQCFATDEPREAMDAFLEKRTPRFGAPENRSW
jgi:enoyl-CoA hydratase/carnithine racemase